jgi:hypothetical protein
VRERGAARVRDAVVAVEIGDHEDDVGAPHDRLDVAGAAPAALAVVVLDAHADRVAGAPPLIGRAGQPADDRDAEGPGRHETSIRYNG